jgi:hypothetical protein
MMLSGREARRDKGPNMDSRRIHDFAKRTCIQCQIDVSKDEQEANSPII